MSHISATHTFTGRTAALELLRDMPTQSVGGPSADRDYLLRTIDLSLSTADKSGAEFARAILALSDICPDGAEKRVVTLR